MRCVHWAGQILVLVETGAAPYQERGHTCGDLGMIWSPYEIHLASEYVQCKRSEGCQALCVTCTREVCEDFRDLSAAEEEFHRREEALIADPQWTRK